MLGEALRRRVDRATGVLASTGAALAGMTLAALLAPHGIPQPLPFQAALALGLGVGMVVAQRPRPSATEWALAAGALCIGATLWIR